MAYPPVVIVDKDDKDIGTAMLAEAWDKGLFYRTVYVMVEDSRGNVLLQKRSKDMLLFPDCWEGSAAGHVDKGQTYEDAARIETAEELGIQNPDLVEMGRILLQKVYQGRKMNHFTKVYRLIVPKDFEFDTNTSEVTALKWFKVSQAKKLFAEHPDKASDGLQLVFEKFY